MEMGDKSSQKRKYIIEKAREVFHTNGYKTVTMKDIVQACEISRGGLYLYFSNTKELFQAVLEEENDNISDILESDRAKNSTPGENMLLYLSAQKNDILKKNDNLSVAVYEYMFLNRSEENDLFKNKFKNEVSALEKLISEGVEQEWMVCENPAQAAVHILHTIEGMKIQAQTIGISSKDIDKEIEYILGTVGLVLE